MRTLFLGSGGFAVPILDALAAEPLAGAITVVTTPARPAGRRQAPRPTPVEVRARALGLPILAPERLRDAATIEAIARLGSDLLVLADYGRIIPARLLELPAHGALNLHPSLLPRHRGATPIPAVILAGDRETGVTLIAMDPGVDTGPIVAQVRTLVEPDETAPHLEGRLAQLGARLLIDALPGWLEGTLVAVSQAGTGASVTRPLRRADGRLDPARGAAALERQVRAYGPWPGSWLDTDRGRLVVWQARVAADAPDGGGPGRLIPLDEGVALVTSDGALELLEVQKEGGRRMSGSDWVRGIRSLPAVLDPSPEGPPGGSAVG
jgi:methionyl-tRNA formyltransferase